jgi:hypothetical protein
LFTGGTDGNVQVIAYCLKTKLLIGNSSKTIKLHQSGINALIISPCSADDDTLVKLCSGGDDGFIHKLTYSTLNSEFTKFNEAGPFHQSTVTGLTLRSPLGLANQQPTSDTRKHETPKVLKILLSEKNGSFDDESRTEYSGDEDTCTKESNIKDDIIQDSKSNFEKTSSILSVSVDQQVIEWDYVDLRIQKRYRTSVADACGITNIGSGKIVVGGIGIESFTCS